MDIWEGKGSQPKSSWWKAQTSFFTAGFKTVWGGFLQLVPKVLTLFWNSVNEFLGNVETKVWEKTFSSYKESGMISEEAYQSILKIKDTGWPWDKLLYIYLNYTLAKDLIFLHAEPSSELVRQGLNKSYRQNLPYFSEILQAAFVAPEKTGEVKEVLKRSGMSDEAIDLLFLSRYRLYSEFEIRTLYLRGVLDTDQMFMRMRELGYTDTRIRELVQSWEIIPPVSDLITMVAKEAFEPDFIRKIGLDAEFPTEQVEWLNKQGISTDWALKYWYAHWDQPSVQMGMEMLHRDVIDEEELDLLFRAQEIPPFWRDKLTKIAYAPYTRVDIRRMHDLGVVGDEELIRAYKDIGYDDEKATNMAIFTIKYNRQKERDLTRGQIVNTYADSMISKQDAIDLLVNLDYSEAQAEYMLMYEDWKTQLDYQEDIIKNIEDKYVNNLITSLEAHNGLGKLNLPAERISILMDKWETKRLKDVKLPSKTDLDKFYTNNVISKDEYYTYMRKLGYPPVIVGWYEKIVEKKKEG